MLTNTSVQVVACWHRPASAAFTPAANAAMDMGGPTDDAARTAVAAARSATPGAEDPSLQVQVVEGYPAQVLIAAAAGATLLVVGSRGHGEMTGMLLGSVGLHCATHAEPVLIVHTRHGR